MDFEKEIKSVHNSWIGGFIGSQYAMSQIGDVIKRQKNTINFVDGILYAGEEIVGENISGRSIVIEKI